jgi:hypothetical protein
MLDKHGLKRNAHIQAVLSMADTTNSPHGQVLDAGGDCAMQRCWTLRVLKVRQLIKDVGKYFYLLNELAERASKYHKYTSVPSEQSLLTVIAI